MTARHAITLLLSSAVLGGCAPLAEDLAAAELEEPVAIPEALSIPEAQRAVDDEGCVRDLPLHAALHWTDAFGEPVPPEELTSWPLGDVDGDGEPEQMLVAEQQCGVTGNCGRLLYLSGKGCARFGGAMWAGWESEEILPQTHHGVHDLRVYLKSGCAGLAGSVDRLEWTGRDYQVVETIECECFDLEPDPGRHPLCPG